MIEETPPAIAAHAELQRRLSLTDRGIEALQEIMRVLRESDREVMALVQRVRELEQLVWSDPLTGLLNRRGLEEALTREEARAGRDGNPIAVVLLDVDGLKAVNDGHGHAAGDALLRTLGLALRAGARASDVVARLGGDEFAALLPGADQAGAAAYVGRLRASTPSTRLPDSTVVAVRFSTGIATREEAGSLPLAFELADQRLLTAKRRALD